MAVVAAVGTLEVPSLTTSGHTSAGSADASAGTVAVASPTSLRASQPGFNSRDTNIKKFSYLSIQEQARTCARACKEWYLTFHQGMKTNLAASKTLCLTSPRLAQDDHITTLIYKGTFEDIGMSNGNHEITHPSLLVLAKFHRITPRSIRCLANGPLTVRYPNSPLFTAAAVRPANQKDQLLALHVPEFDSEGYPTEQSEVITARTLVHLNRNFPRLKVLYPGNAVSDAGLPRWPIFKFVVLQERVQFLKQLCNAEGMEAKAKANADLTASYNANSDPGTEYLEKRIFAFMYRAKKGSPDNSNPYDRVNLKRHQFLFTLTKTEQFRVIEEANTDLLLEDLITALKLAAHKEKITGEVEVVLSQLDQQNPKLSAEIRAGLATIFDINKKLKYLKSVQSSFRGPDLSSLLHEINAQEVIATFALFAVVFVVAAIWVNS